MHRLLVIAATVLAALALSGTAGAWSWPADGQVLRPFVLGGNAYAAGQHRGIDVAGPDGSPVRAPAAGTVTFAGSLPTYGRGVTIVTADGYAVTLVHLGSIEVAKGGSVAEGARVGTMGSSGEPEHPVPSVHLGIRLTAQTEGYVDPLGLLPPRAGVPSPTQAPPAPAPAPAPAQAVPSPPEAQSYPSAPSPVPAPAPASSTPGSAVGTTAPASSAPGASAAGIVGASSPGALPSPRSPAGDVQQSGLPAPGAPSAAPERPAGIDLQVARGGPVGGVVVSSSARPLVLAAGRPGPPSTAAPASGARSSTRLAGTPFEARAGAVSSRAAAGTQGGAVLGAVAGPRAGSAGTPERGVSRMAAPSGADPGGRPVERLRAANTSAQELGARDARRPVGAGSSRPVEGTPDPGAGGTGRGVGTSGALTALVVLLAVAGLRKAVRRIGADGAVLRHHADLLRQLHAAHRARVHDGGGGRLRSPSAAARP